MLRRSEQRHPSQVSSQIFDAVTNNEVRRLKQILKESPDLDFIEMTNSQMETLLHIACQYSGMLILELIIQYFEEKCSQNQQQMLRHFIDMRNSEGFTCIHLAAFAGKLEMIELLSKKGGSLHHVNAAGLTAMHTSAQGDQVAVMLFLKMQGLSIEQKDHNDRTPLHWGAYQSATNAVSFLLTWGARLEEYDSDNKMTALHYAVISGSTAIVRKLLLAGADRNAKDSENQTPLDHAKEKDLETIAGILSSKPGLAEACNIKQPFEKLRKKKRLLVLFGSMYMSSFLGSLFFVIPYVASTEIVIPFYALSFVSLVFYFLAWLRDPGYLIQKQKSPDRLLDLLRSVDDPSSICSKCEIVQPARSKHCDICGHCVKVYDHHCPWINNCVGAQNYKYFYGFVFSIFIQLAFQVFFHSLYFSQTEPIDKYIFEMFESREVMETLHLITSIYCTCMCLFFLICVGILLYVQTQNLISGMTTSEKYGYKGGAKTVGASSQSNVKQVEKQVDAETRTDEQDAMNYSIASDNVSTMLENEQGLLVGFKKQHDRKESVIGNMWDMCFRNNKNPSFDFFDPDTVSFNARGSQITRF